MAKKFFKPKHGKKPLKPKKPAKIHRPGKPDPDKVKKRPGKKPQKPIKRRPPPRSGYIPVACKPLIASPNLLDCWLEHNPNAAEAIVWEPDPGFPATPLLAWPNWTASMKAQLRQAWIDARQWHANGMTGFAGTVIEDPPANKDYPPDDGYFRTVFDAKTQAWPLYLAHVAHSLAMEIGGWVPWTIRTYSSEALEHLLSAWQMFRHDTNDGGPWDSDYPGGYVLGGAMSVENVTPSHPTFTFPFLTQNGLIDSSVKSTIARVLNWCRWNLSHYLGGFTPQNAEYHWQYRGNAPVRRIIEGTLLLDPQYAPMFQTPQHWTPGCWGTSSFLRSLLRAVNIPVVPRVCGCGHIVPHFVTADLYLSHGDDPYDALSKADYPADLLLLDKATFESWFPHDPNDPENPDNYATACQNVGRRVVDLAVWHFSDYLLDFYCSDKAAGLDHQSSKVFSIFKDYGYTVADLEAVTLWERLATEAQAKGKC